MTVGNVFRNALISSQGMVTGTGGIQALTDGDPLTPEADPTCLYLNQGPPVLDVFASVTDLDGGTVMPGNILEYKVRIIHTENRPAADVVYRDQPAGFLSLTPGSISNDKGLVITGNGEGDAAAELFFDTLEPGESATAYFHAVVSEDAPDGETILNQGAVRSREALDELADHHTTATVNDPVPDRRQPRT